MGDFALFKRKKMEGIAIIFAFFEKKQFQRKNQAFFIICPRNEQDDMKNNDLDENSLKKSFFYSKNSRIYLKSPFFL